MRKRQLQTLSRKEMREYLFEIQDHVDGFLKSGRSVDTFLDETDIFDEFEQILPDEEYGVFVITLLNRIRTDSIIDGLLDVIESSLDGENAHPANGQS